MTNIVRLSTIAVLCAVLVSAYEASAQTLSVDPEPAPQIRQPVTDEAYITLLGSKSPRARDDYDSGAAPADLALSRMLLLLKPTRVQTQQLKEYLREVQDPTAANYHRWLTPEEFGARYGVAKADIRTVTGWLEQLGLSVGEVAAGAGWIEFSGTVAQVEAAFHTTIHTYSSGGVRHTANASDLQIPVALSPVVAGVVSINDFESVAAHISITTSTPGADKMAASEGLTPAEFAAIYNLRPLYQGGYDGGGQSIAVIERSDIHLADIEALRNKFSLPANDPQVILNGPDPGVSVADRNSDAIEALLDASWAGAVAPKAAVKVIASASTHATDGVDLSIAYAVDHATAPVIEIGYVACEASLDVYHRQFYAATWAQAAAEGITVVAAAGNSGAAGCEDASGTDRATTGFAVNGIASTPYNTAVGGTSVLSMPVTVSDYLPESGWSAAEGVRAGGGGTSSIYATPGWQVTTGVPGSDPESPGQHHRYLPDVSLNASHGYGLCIANSCGQGPMVQTAGTAAAAAAFAGVMALVDEYTRSAQGNAAPVLYALARKGLAFHDVTTGSNRVACVPGFSGCDATGTIGYGAAPGFDLATGLGSIDATAFIENYASAAATGTQQALASLSPSSITVFTGAAFTITAKVISAASNGETPSGTVTFLDSVTGSLGTATLTNGSVSFSAPTNLSAGSHVITGLYSGDSNYAPATSNAISTDVVQGTAVIALTASSLTPAYGTNYTAMATMQATTTVNNTQPTGTVAFTLDSTAVGSAVLKAGATGATATLMLVTPTPGKHSLGATYSGDDNFPAVTAAPLTVDAQKGASVTTLVANPTTLMSGVPITFTATITNTVSGVTPPLGFTGNVVFYDGTIPVGSQVNVTNNQAVLPNITLDPTVTHIITAQYYGDGNWAGSTSTPLTLTVAPAASVTMLTASSAAALSGTPLTFTAVVTGTSTTAPTAIPTGMVTFLDGTTAIGTGPLAANLGQATATFTTSNLSGGEHTITAKYPGDTNFAASTSTAATVTIVSYSVTPSTTNLTVTAGQSGSVVFTVVSGLSVPIQFGCQPPTGTGTSCMVSPASVTGDGKTTMTVTTTAPSTASSRRSPALFAGGAGVAVCIALLCLPFGHSANRRLQQGTLLVLALFAALPALGCGSSSATTVPGSPSGIQVMTVITSVTVNNQTATQRLYISVNVVNK